MSEVQVVSKTANRAGVENCPPSTVVRNGAGVTRVDSPALTDLIETTRTTRHVQDQRTPAPRRRPDEPVVREKPGVVAAVQRIVGASPDDMWGDGTSAAVQKMIMEFEKKNGLPVTGRYTQEIAQRMRVHSDTETKDLANALDAVKNLHQYYRVAPVRTVTETQERRVPAPGGDQQTDTDGHGDVGVCTVLSAGGGITVPAAIIQPSGETDKEPPTTTTTTTIPDIQDPTQPVTGGRVLDAADSLWLSRESTSKGRASSPPQAQPDWMGAAAELGAALRGAGGEIREVTAQNEPNHGVKDNSDHFYTASLGGMMA